MAKVPINRLQAGYRSSQSLNANLETIENAFDNTLSRDGTGPNQMEAQLDMNSNRIINLPAPVDNADAVRKVDIAALDTIVDTAAEILEDAEAAAAAAIAAQVAAELAETHAETAEVAAEAAQVAAEEARDEAVALLATKVSLTALAAGTGATLMGFLQSGTSAIALTADAMFKAAPAFPEQFAAVGDGVALDATEFQALLTAHKRIRLKPGATYKVETTLVPQSGTKIDLNGATIVQGTDQTPIFNLSGVDDFEIYGGNITGIRSDFLDSPSSAARAFTVSTANASNIRIHDIKFKWFGYAPVAATGVYKINGLWLHDNDITGPGLIADGGTLSAANNNNTGVTLYGDGLFVYNNRFRDTALGIIVAAGSTTGVVAGNVFENVKVEHAIYGDTGLKDFVFADNHGANIELEFLKIQFYDSYGVEPENIVIRNNTARDTGSHFISVLNTTGGSPTLRARGVIIEGNTGRDIGGDFYNVRHTVGAILRGNIGDGGGRYGIYAISNTNALFQGNTILNTQEYGFLDGLGNTQCKMEGGLFKNNGLLGGIGATVVGIEINAEDWTLDNVTVIGDSTVTRYCIIFYGGANMTVRNCQFLNAKETGGRFIGTPTFRQWTGNIGTGLLGEWLGFPTGTTQGEASHLHYFGQAVPSSGTFLAGAFVRNTGATAVGDPFGWYCRTAGTPGTWSAFGALGLTRATAVADLTITASAGTLPTANGSVNFADAAAPTNAELLEAIIELQAKINSMLSTDRTANQRAA